MSDTDRRATRLKIILTVVGGIVSGAVRAVIARLLDLATHE